MCTRPRKMFPIGLTASGKTKYAICDYIVDHVEIDSKGRWRAFTSQDRVSSYSVKVVRDWIPGNCGECEECLLQRSREWANRLIMEKSSAEHAYFITLTYDNDHVPLTYSGDPDTGEVDLAAPVQTLRKTDLRNWFKRLRKAFVEIYGNPVKYNTDDPSTWNDPRRVRYFACGEYGTQTFRPHYHVIMFSPEIPDLRLYKRSWNNDPYYNSDFINKTWSLAGKQLGHAVVAEVTWESCAYVARYCLKKNTADKRQLVSGFGIEPEFQLQSTKPGIAACYYLEHPDCLNYDYINISAGNKGVKFAPPRYFWKLFEREYGTDDPRKEEKQKRARARLEHTLDNTTLSFEEQMEVKARAVHDRTTKLIRRLDTDA